MATGYAGKRVKMKPAADNSRKKISSATVGELRSNFKAIEAKLAKGVRVQITRRGEVVAEMLAPAVENMNSAGTPKPMPDYEARLKRIWGKRPVSVDTTALISEGRERDRVS